MARVTYIIENQLPKHQLVPSHSHSCYELIYYIKSNVRMDYEQIAGFHSKHLLDFESPFSSPKNYLIVKSSEFVIIPPNIIHNEVNYEEHHVVAIGFEFDKNETISNDFFLTKLHDYDFKILKLIRLIAQEFVEKKYMYNDYIDNLFNEVLIHLHRRTKKINAPDKLKYIISYLDQNFAIPLSIDKAAEMAGYSNSRFRSIFKETTGLSPKQFISEKRFEHAKYLLEKTDCPLEEIASLCGFSDYFQFSAFFKSKSGKPPSRYKINFNKN